MSKFAFVIEIKNGKPFGTAYSKEEAHKAKELFTKLRDSGKEAYYSQHPAPDKRSKSSEQMDASKGTEGTELANSPENPAPAPQPAPQAVDFDDDIVILENPSSGKNSIGGV